MRSDIAHSVSDGECDKFDCDAAQVVRAEQVDTNMNQSATYGARCVTEHAQKLYPNLPQSANEIQSAQEVKDEIRMEENLDSAAVATDEQLKSERQRSASASSSAMEENGHAGEDSRLAYRKIFVGGLNWQTTEVDLREYFGQFGEIQSCQIKYDATSKQPRGFGFVVFEQEECVARVLAIRDQHRIRGKRVDPKPAKPSKDVSRKIFVGGIDPGATHEQILEYFSQFGKVESLDLPFDNAKSTRKNYVFIAYATKQEALAATRSAKQLICGRMCDVRIAVPRDQILKMQSRSTATGQAPLKFPAPSSPTPSAYVYPRNYSGPAALTPGGSPAAAAMCNSMSTQPEFTMTPTRFRTMYRSEPGCGYQTPTQTNGQASPVYARQAVPPVAQPTPPFQFAFQGAPSQFTSPSQFNSPYQLCFVDQSIPQAIYASYCTAVSHECGVQPSMIAMPAYSTMVVGPGSPQQAGLVQQLVSPNGYTYQPYATAYAQPGDMTACQPPAGGVYAVAPSGTRTIESLAVAPGCSEVVQQPDALGAVQYSTAQPVLPLGVTYTPVAGTAGCIQQQPPVTDTPQMANYVPFLHDSGLEATMSCSRKRPPNV